MSLILSVVMMISLLAGANAPTVKAADEFTIELLTGSTKGLAIGSKTSDVSVSKMTLGTTSISYSNLKITVNDGEMDLDPDNKIVSGKAHTLTLEFEVDNPASFTGVASAKIATYGSTYDKSFSDYVTGTLTISGNKVTVKANIAAYPNIIGIEEKNR